MPEGWRNSPPFLGFLVGLCLLGLYRLAPVEWRYVQQERTFDILLRAVAPLRTVTPPPPIVHVDIDDASLMAVGRWPWKRETIATLVETLSSASPAVIALDVVFAGVDTQSPAALARKLGSATGRADITDLAASLPDGDRALSRAIDGKPVILGWVLDPQGKDSPPLVPIFLRGAPTPLALWQAKAASAPGEQVAGAAAGSGAVSLPGDPDGVVRRVPLFVTVGADIFPGFAAEMLRVTEGASAYIAAAAEGRVEIGRHRVPLSRDGMVRLLPRLNSAAPVRIAASDVLGDRFDRSAIKDGIVIVGGSAAETGGLRASIDDPLTPSSLIHAAAFRQLATGATPAPPEHAIWIEMLASLLLLGLAIAAASGLRPLSAVLVASVLLASWAGGALAAAARDVLINPAPGIVVAGFGFAATLIGAFSQTRLREALLRRRFEQHLAPSVVERIVANPSSLRLTGERRIVTALFTDIEGFTTTARDTDPEQLIAVLDGYFEGVSRIVVEHGGMIDKFVGDAVHAFFNLPFDVDGHESSAIACGKAIADWSDQYRRSERPSAIGLGRTRIGIETGPVVAGDVGLSTKLDYTAHGSAVNLAARLEALNKEFGTAILVGPVAAAAAHETLHSLGRHEIRGFGAIEVFTVNGDAGVSRIGRKQDGSEGGI